MLTEEGFVEKTWRGKALVRIQRGAGCAHCEYRGACEILSGEKTTVEVVNRLQAQPGDRVQVSMPEGSLWKLSLLVYFCPVIALVVGGCLGAAWASSSHVDATLPSILGAGLGFAGAFYLLKKINRSVQHNQELRPVVTRILFSEVSAQAGKLAPK